jgi:hypothetical protein
MKEGWLQGGQQGCPLEVRTHLRTNLKQHTELRSQLSILWLNKLSLRGNSIEHPTPRSDCRWQRDRGLTLGSRGRDERFPRCRSMISLHPDIAIFSRLNRNSGRDQDDSGAIAPEVSVAQWVFYWLPVEKWWGVGRILNGWREE